MLTAGFRCAPETLPMNRMIAITIRPGATTAAVRLIVSGNACAHHAAAGGDEDEEERPEQLREEPAPFLARVVEVLERGVERRAPFRRSGWSQDASFRFEGAEYAVTALGMPLASPAGAQPYQSSGRTENRYSGRRRPEAVVVRSIATGRYRRSMRETPSAVRWLISLVREVLARYGRIGGSQFAAAISYRALFSLVPLATFVATILAQVLSSSSVDRQDLVWRSPTSSTCPRRDARLDSLITSVPSPWSPAGLFALGLALWGATGVMNSMQKRSPSSSTTGPRAGSIRGRLVSGLLVLGALGLILCVVALSMLENVARK